MERTLNIVKPDAVAKGAVGEILRRFQAAGLRLVGAKLMKIDGATASRFYAVHKERPFFGSLTEFMSSGPVFVSVLEGDNAIARARELMGATDSLKAAEGTIRRDFGTDVEKNAVHGSDGPDTAKWEISFFFGQHELQEG